MGLGLGSGGHGFESVLIFGFFFSSTFENFLSFKFWWAILPVLKALHCLILYDHLYSYLRSIVSLLSM